MQSKTIGRNGDKRGNVMDSKIIDTNVIISKYQIITIQHNNRNINVDMNISTNKIFIQLF